MLIMPLFLQMNVRPVHACLVHVMTTWLSTLARATQVIPACAVKLTLVSVTEYGILSFKEHFNVTN
jgi:hypothetical protein